MKFVVGSSFALQLLLVMMMANRASSSSSALEEARLLELPIPESTEDGEFEGTEFWDQHAALLRSAWREWEAAHAPELPSLRTRDMLDERLREVVDEARRNHEAEGAIKQLWTQAADGVYRCQLLNPTQIQYLREHIDGAAYERAKIPTRRPNGMNRYGLILHPSEVEGAASLSEFERFYNDLVDEYVRPVARLLFPEYVSSAGDDAESYAFTIRYKADEDLALREHSDASLFTLNVNLNRPEEAYEGSSVLFFDKDKGTNSSVAFEPGEALLHLGQVRHAALPLTAGERTNLVIWLFGKDDYVRIVPYEHHEWLSREERWVKPDSKDGIDLVKDKFLNYNSEL